MTREIETPRDGSWRQIRQAVNPRTMTRQGRRRFGWNLARTVFSVLTIVALAGAGAYLWMGFEKPSETLSPVIKAEPLREVVLITDGVLDKDWVVDRLALPEGIALMAIDLDMARVRLESEGQVRNAVLAREFPGTLVVTLQERVPVVRIMVPTSREGPEPMLVGRDGYVYRGFNYDPDMIRQLPWLDGVHLKRRANGFAPIAGLDEVSELLLTARTEAPHLAADWKVVSLESLPLIKVRTRYVGSIVFEPDGYRRQLARLDYILDHFRSQGVTAGQVASIDLSLPSQVAVDLAGADGNGPARLNLTAPVGALPGGNNSFVRNLPNSKNRGL